MKQWLNIRACSSVAEHIPDKNGVVGPIPTTRTSKELMDSEEENVWVCRRHAHAVSPVFANEFWVRNPFPAGRAMGKIDQNCYNDFVVRNCFKL